MPRAIDQNLPGIVRMRAAAKTGECPFCGDPIPVKLGKGRKPRRCSDDECRKAYFRCHQRDSRQRKRAALSGPEVAVCNTRPSSVISDLAGA